MKSKILLKISGLLICIFSISSFIVQKNDEIRIDRKIKKSQEFKLLNKENEIEMGIDIEKPKTKRSSNVNYMETTELRCGAIFDKKNNLKIVIYNNDGLGSFGFDIDILKRKYKINPFHSSDIGGTEYFYDSEIKDQVLVLDKKNYKLGDSIYGFVDFEINQLYKNENSYRPHKGKGYFRALIKKRL